MSVLAKNNDKMNLGIKKSDLNTQNYGQRSIKNVNDIFDSRLNPYGSNKKLKNGLNQDEKIVEANLLKAFYQMNELSDAIKSNVIDVKNILRQNGIQTISSANGFVDWSGANGHMVGWRGRK